MYSICVVADSGLPVPALSPPPPLSVCVQLRVQSGRPAQLISYHREDQEDPKLSIFNTAEIQVYTYFSVIYHFG